MNTEEMVQDNVNTASTVEIGEIGPEEEAMLKRVGAAINSKLKVGCTGCAYCMSCPKKVDIPETFAAYNKWASESKFWGVIEYMKSTAFRKDIISTSNCMECGKCEKHCPQNIEIRQELKAAGKNLEGSFYKVVCNEIRWLKAF